MKTTILAAITAISTLHATTESPPPPPKPVVDVVFVIDSTGSMSSLIEGAKEKIWSIANSIVTRKPTPAVRIGLVSYRDRGDAYVTRAFDLTDDIDTVFKDLQTIRADGGGDEPESVNQALAEAVSNMKWSTAKDTTKIIFLVGDCPPHMDYQDDIKYQATCEKAAKSNIIINTVQCGNHQETTAIWQEIAKRAEGTYLALAQSGGMTAIATPHDDEIAKLSKKIGMTSIGYGSISQQSAVKEKNARAAEAPAAVSASRAEFNSKTGGKAVQGHGDLLADIAEGVVHLDEVKNDLLPANMQTMSAPEKTQYIESLKQQRSTLNKQLDELVSKRAAFIAQEKSRLRSIGKGDGFDLKVEETIQAQIDHKHAATSPR